MKVGDCVLWHTLGKADVCIYIIFLDASKSGKYQGVCIWFDCHFPQLSNNDPVVLSTHPGSPTTHWKQAVIVLPDEQEVEIQEPIAFQIDMYRDDAHLRR